MKNKFTIIIISLLIISFLIYMFLFRCHRKLPEVSNYNIVSNTGMTIPAKLYSRTVKAMIDGKEENIDEFILCFNDTLISNQLNVSGDNKLYKFLVIIPNQKIIGLINGMDALNEKETYVCQENDEADNFTSIINNRTFFSNPPIKEASFTDNKVIFNTYGVLKQFGESIIIETNRDSK